MPSGHKKITTVLTHEERDCITDLLGSPGLKALLKEMEFFVMQKAQTVVDHRYDPSPAGILALSKIKSESDGAQLFFRSFRHHIYGIKQAKKRSML